MSFRNGILLVGSILVLNGCGGGTPSQQGEKSSSQKSMETKSPVDPATAGSISGTVKISGTVPKSKNLSMSADPFCKSAHTTAVKAEDIVVNPNGTLKNVLVYVKSGLDSLQFPIPAEAAELDQVGCIYIPHLIAIQKGQKLIIKNSDSVLHNVNARPSKNKPFNFAQPVKGMKSEKVFDNAEIAIPVKCDVHPWMGGYIAVLGHPGFGVSGDNGSFNIGNLPPGNYEIEAWHEKLGTSTQKVTIGAKETKKLDFVFKGA